jgi:hypothetical protein
MIDSIVREKASNQIRVPAVPRGAKFFRTLARHFCTHLSLLNQVSGPNTNAVAMDVQNGSQSCVEAELRVLNLTKPMTAKQLELFCNDVCERLNFTLTKSDRREEVVSWVEHWQALWL